ncbi:hypothetical protein [Streptomyces sp. KS 21]|uniref:GNAT family N-acetyltransferase n=1 Tax=Streptomyces sp. KS 21 TaxID=2485150 RepID=UPI0010638D68|nr:hypothetical protein [Streptomyces sp. KS 21]TDU75013.1 hypothetical protein EDD91_1679 [Streptomyces sp. KS 21]
MTDTTGDKNHGDKNNTDSTDRTDSVWRTRPETAADAAAVRSVNLAAFETPLEADLVDALRTDASWLPGLSYVAEGPEGSVTAHALLTRCEVDGVPALALAPVATLPDEAMMALVLDASAPVPQGTIAYPAPFGI